MNVRLVHRKYLTGREVFVDNQRLRIVKQISSLQPGLELGSTMTEGVVIIVCLLTIVCGETHPELKLISELNNYFDFDHNNFLLESSVDIDRFISAGGPTPRTIYAFKDVNENTAEVDTLQEIRGKNTFTIVALDGSSFDRSFEFFKQFNDSIIQPLQFNIKIGIFFQQFVSADNLRKLFEWCKEEPIAHVFAASYVQLEGMEGKKGLMATSSDVLNIFTFEHFGTLNVINVTTSEKFEAYFPGLQSNFHQYKLGYMPKVIEDEYWLTIYRMMNISTEDNNFPDWPLTVTGFFYVYPTNVITFVMVVPHAVPYEGFSAYIQLVATDKFVSFSLVTIATVIFALTIFRYIKNSKVSVFQTVADVFNILMNDNGCIRYQRLSRAEVLVIGPLTFVGLIVMNGILSVMQSYLTEPVFQPQIKTLEDLHRSAFPILVDSEEDRKDTIKHMEIRSKLDWSDKVKSVGSYKMWRQVFNFNSSISFPFSSDYLECLIRFQKRYNVKAYYDTKIAISSRFVDMVVQARFMFFERFNEINHRMKSAGLIQLWDRWNYDVLTEHLLIANSELLKKWKEDQNEKTQFEFPSSVIYGWIASGIVFIVEIFWMKIKFEYSRITRLLMRMYRVKFTNFR